MINQLRLYQGDSFDPHYNLAVEQHLMETVPDGCCILYLWQNAHTVVIGRNQNAWKECRTQLLEEEGGHLARRLSGGGAVYHDLGNLNFTFLLPSAEYDVDRQLSVIVEACHSLGISAEKSGRNDVLSEGRKFSGNAFFKHNGRAYHHGTLMVDVDKEKLGRYLSPSKAKLIAKGVDSVRSRVVNLRELRTDLTIPMLKEALTDAFSKVYGLPVEEIGREELDHSTVESICQRNRSWEWNYGIKLPFSFSCEERFSWGSVQLAMQVESGVIKQTKAYSDSMDWSISSRLEEALTGCQFTLAEMEKALRRQLEGEEPVCQDLCRMLGDQDI